MSDKPVFEELSAAAGPRADYAAWLGEILKPSDPTLAALGGNWDAYTSLLRDDQVSATFQQRRLAHISADWEVDPASNRLRDRKAAEFIQEQLTAVRWDDVCDKMMFGLFYGLSVAECLWARDGSAIVLAGLKVRRAGRFCFDRDLNLRLITRAKPLGEVMPARKFWVFRCGGGDDDDPYGLGLAAILYWPVWFKRQGARMWAVALEKFAAPTAYGKYPPGASQDAKDALLEAAQSIASEQAVTIPDGMQLELLEAKRASGGDYAQFCAYWDASIAKVLLSQTMTTDNGSSKAQAAVHLEVRDDVIKADADRLCASFNDSVVKWLTEWNFPGAGTPRVWRRTDPPLDLKTEAERDKLLFDIGYRPGAERIAEVYGDGYEAVAAPAPAAVPPGANDQPAADPGAGFAEGATDAIDPLVEQLGVAADPLLAAMVERLRAAIEEAGSLDKAAERMLTLYPELGIDGLAEIIAKAGAVAQLQGMVDAGA